MDYLRECLFGTDLTWYVCLFRLVISFFAGCAMGLERKFRTQFVGMRTLILICVSSTMLMLLSIYMSSLTKSGAGDPSRIAAQVVSGIGFLGTGAILRHGFNVRGLTSAAIIWAAAALGLAIGAGFLFAAGIVLVICLVSLIVIEGLEEHFFPAEQIKILRLYCCEKVPDNVALCKSVAEFGIVISSLQSATCDLDGNFVLTYNIRMPKQIDFSKLACSLKQEFFLHTVALE